MKLGEKIEMTDRRIWRRLEQQGIKMQYFAFRYRTFFKARPNQYIFKIANYKTVQNMVVGDCATSLSVIAASSVPDPCLF